MNPYEVLGILPSVSEEEIKVTYRTLAKRFHPDRCPGDEEAKKKYAEVDQAYQILSDPEKRKKYDETGEFKETRNTETEELVQVLMPILLSKIQEHGRRGTNLREIDLIAEIQQKVDEDKGNFNVHIAGLKRGIEHMKQAVCRFAVDGDRENVLESIVRKEISNNEQAIANIEAQVARLVRVLDYLKTCKYDWANPWDLFKRKVQEKQLSSSDELFKKALELLPKSE